MSSIEGRTGEVGNVDYNYTLVPASVRLAEFNRNRWLVCERNMQRHGWPGERTSAHLRHLVHRTVDLGAELVSQDDAGHAAGEPEPGGAGDGTHALTFSSRFY